MFDEQFIIKYLKSEFPEKIGDDAACIQNSTNEIQVITKDILNEDIHFRTRYFSPENLAHKSLHVNISDIVAMGGYPESLVLGISTPNHKIEYIEKFLQYFTKKCKENSINIIGGDTTGSIEHIFISITLIGKIENANNIKYRNSANEGDIICVVGNLGNAHIGFTALEKNYEGFESFKQNFLRPNALLKEGLWLSKQSEINAMMDISDGLVVDLEKLCESSNLGAEIHIEQLQASQIFRDSCKKLELSTIETQLTGGEDYGLLVTVKKDSYHNLLQKFEKNFGYKVKNIGHIINEKSVHFMKNGIRKNLQLKYFSHF